MRRSDAEKKEFMDQVLPGRTVLQLAHMALGVAVQESIETSLARAHHVLQNASSASLTSSAEGDKKQQDVAELIRQANVRLEKLEELPGMISYELGVAKRWTQPSGLHWQAARTEIFLICWLILQVLNYKGFAHDCPVGPRMSFKLLNALLRLESLMRGYNG
jgi:hypothetical protein